MVKSVSCCCAHGSRLFSDLITYVCMYVMYMYVYDVCMCNVCICIKHIFYLCDHSFHDWNYATKTILLQ